jgi:hypothetical protein
MNEYNPFDDYRKDERIERRLRSVPAIRGAATKDCAATVEKTARLLKPAYQNTQAAVAMLDGKQEQVFHTATI